MDKELKQKIIDLHLKYKSRGEIAKELDINLVTVVSAIKSYYINNVFGRKVRAKKPTFLDKHLQEVKKMAKNGHTLRQIAEELGVSDATVVRCFKKHGIKSRPKAADSKLGKKILRLRKQNMTLEAIAKKLKISVRRVHYVTCYAVSIKEMQIFEQKKPKKIENNILQQLKKGLKND